MEKQYYSLKRLLETKCYWLILYGMRSNGKSYAVKEHCIKEAYQKNIKFIYLRRWRDDIKEKEVAAYFDDMPVSKFTNGEYIGITAWRGFFYFYNIDEKDEVKRSHEPIGRYLALNIAERYKSQAFVDYDNIIYEEFLTNGVFLDNEPDKLQQLVSTIARDRNVHVFMIGNTISRVCPYFSSWGLRGTMQQKPGTIDIYHLKGDNGVVDIAVENCEVVARESKMFFGRQSKQIISGDWETMEVAKLPKHYAYYDMVYEILVKFNDFKFCLQLLVDGSNGALLNYIYPLTTERKIRRVITSDFSDDIYVNNGLKSNIKAELIMNSNFKNNKVCYSDNLTGTDFANVLKEFKFGGMV